MARKSTKVDFSNAPLEPDMVLKERSHSHATLQTSSMRSSVLSMSDYTHPRSISDNTHPHPGDKGVPPSPATAIYFSEEGAFDEEEEDISDEDQKEEKKEKKKKKKKKKEEKRSSHKEIKRSSSERLSCRQTEGTSEALERSSSGRPSLEGKKHRRREDDHMMAIKEGRREEMENQEYRREHRRRMRNSHAGSSNRPRKDEHLCGHRVPYEPSLIRYMHIEQPKGVTLTQERREKMRNSPAGSSNRPREDEHLCGHRVPYEPSLIRDMHIEQPKGVTLTQEQREKNRSRRPEMDVPKFIEVVMNSPHSLGPESVIPDQQTSRSSTTSDYERLMQMLGEQSEVPARNPLITSSDGDLQEAFDALARDCVFDDNFEKAFNEFSEHYLALSPWGEDDTMNTCGKGDKSINNQLPFNEADYIQIPLTPVSRRGLISDIPRDLDHGSSKLTERPRTPTVEKGRLNDNAMEKFEKKEVQGGDEFVEISRSPYHRRKKVIPDDDSDSVGKSNAGHSSLPANFNEFSPAPSDKTKKRHKNWNILRGRRSSTSATF